MFKRNTQWLKGFELFDEREESIRNELKLVESLLELSIPLEIKKYFERFKPIDVDDEIFYSKDVNLILGDIVFTNKIGNINYLPLGQIYDVNEIINRIEYFNNSTLEDVFRKLKAIPIASNGSNEGNIIISVREYSDGKIFNFSEIQYGEFDDSHLIAENIYEFIEGISIIPWKEED